MEKHEFLLQWHVTAKCQQHCKHCYMYDEPTYANEIANELSFSECMGVLDSFEAFCNKMNVRGCLTLTGGDPLLRDDIFEIIASAKKRDFRVCILGNPFLIDDSMPTRLKEAGISHYQLSLDGMKEIHDQLRKPGSFDSTIHSIKRLKEEGITVHIMNTLSRLNKQDLLPLMKLVGELGVDVFAFARITCNGSGKQFHDINLDPLEYREILAEVDKYSKELNASGVKTIYAHKCHLWKLYQYEEEHFSLLEDKETIFGGCSIGISGIVLLADGTAMACRRFPSYVGNIKEKSIYDLFLSPEMNQYRQIQEMEKCSKCELVQICRGCPAASYGMHGRWTAPDPQCWKNT